MFAQVKEFCGKKAAIVHAFIVNQEQTRNSGACGLIHHTPERIAEHLKMDKNEVISILISLCRFGFIKINGDRAKAA